MKKNAGIRMAAFLKMDMLTYLASSVLHHPGQTPKASIPGNFFASDLANKPFISFESQYPVGLKEF